MKVVTLNPAHITYHRACAYNLTYRHIYIYIYVYVIARVGVKFVPEVSRLTVLLQIKGARTPDTQRPRTFYLMVAMHSLPLLFYF